MVGKTENTVRKNRRDDQPDRRKRNDDIRYDRADASVAHENCGDKIEIENSVKSPIHGAQQNEYIRHKIGNEHLLTSCTYCAPFFPLLFMSALFSAENAAAKNSRCERQIFPAFHGESGTFLGRFAI